MKEAIRKKIPPVLCDGQLRKKDKEEERTGRGEEGGQCAERMT